MTNDEWLVAIDECMNKIYKNSAEIKCDRCGEVNPAEVHTCSPQTKWQSLTADEIWEEWHKQANTEHETRNFVAAFARAIELKLKEKNT